MARLARVYVIESTVTTAGIKSLLLANGIRHLEINVAGDREMRERLIQAAGDLFPIVELDDVYVAGATPASVQKRLKLRFSDPFSRVPGSCC